MQSKQLTGSRTKSILFLCFSAGFVFMASAAHPVSIVRQAVCWLGIILFSAGACAFVWLAIRPQRLLLEPDGFTVSGGLVRKPEKVAWTDIEEIVLIRLPRNATTIGYNFRPSARTDSRLQQINRSFGADAGIPGVWKYTNEQIVEELNHYREKALSSPVQTASGFGRKSSIA